jgi:chemotaxis methyl-accepting protein methylase
MGDKSFPLVTDGDLTRVAALLQARAGFRGDPLLLGRLGRCLEEAARDAGQPLGAYITSLPRNDGALQGLVDRVTIHESCFFRDEGQFDTLAREVLPTLPAGVIWSAGCANGQEAWSLAITLLEQGRKDCAVLATDISTKALQRAAEGRYRPQQLRGLSPERRDRWFVARDGEFEVGPEARRLVRFAHHNLASGPLPFQPGSCRLVFCRNVIIYFPDDEITALLDRIATGIGPDGLLFLGYSETLSWLKSPFERLRLGDTFVYRVAGGDGAQPRAARARMERRVPAARRSVPPAPRPPAPHPNPSTPEPAASVVNADSGRADPFLAEGQDALAAGDTARAVAAFRKAAYLRPGDATVLLHLAFAFDALGDPEGARRWFRLAHESITSSGGSRPALDGWSADELTRLLERKLATPGEVL